MEDMIRKNIVETLRDCNIDNDSLAKSLAKMNLEDGAGLSKGFQNLVIDQETIDIIEYIRNDDSSAVKEKEEKWLNPKEDDTEEEEDWEWMDLLRDANTEKFNKETYFANINWNRKTMKKGEEAFISYGCRTNYFLLQSYGFCFINNLYESYKFYVKLDIVTGYNQSRKLGIKDMIA